MSEHAQVLGPEFFVPDLPRIDPGPLVAQGRVLDAVLEATELRGTLADLAGRLNVLVADLRAAIGELTAVGWIAVETGARRELVLRWLDA